MINVNQLQVRYGKKPVVDGISFNAEPGQVTVIIGPNGSGKSSLMGGLSGDIDYEGSVVINGKEVRDASVVDLADIRGVLSQFSNLTFPFTVHEVVDMGLRASGLQLLNDDEIGLSEKALERVGLAGFSSRRYHELSGGEQQRVQLARVLCQVWHPVFEHGSRWLFLDEPVSSLDIRHQLTIMDLSREYADERGGVVAIMHDLNLSAMYADHVVLMKAGKILAQGKPEEVICDAFMEEAFDCPLKVAQAPSKHERFVLPHSARF